jgi:Tol biopolymer transport system component/tRNA A-37 threonylcarbamoyl transferase component Bud32
MGEVWKARDTRLDRIVAIKVSKGRFSDRFEGEARAVAALNHPNICQLYDVGPDYLVMEFIEGSRLAPVDQPRKLLDLAVQIADGLAAAHAAGIIHRDLKPGNILVTRDGKVKILDFGLAKAAAQEIAPGDSTYTIYQAATMTGPGLTVGTSAYMSPEQARGQRNLTAQSDQFSLGLVLYELASGKRAFQRGTTAETLTAIIREDADPLPGSVPAPLRWIIERLLAKEPAERYDSTRDLYRELRQLRDRPSETASVSSIPAASGQRKWPRLPGIGLLTAGLALGFVLTALLIRPAPPDLSAYKFTPISRDEATERHPVWSPDGKSIAYTADMHGIYQVFTKVVGAPDTAQLTHATGSCGKPMWSPDSATIYYVSHGDLWSVGASGGTPELVMANASETALHPDGKTLVFNRDGKRWAGPLRGGTPTELTQGPQGDITSISFSPDGSKLAVVADRTLWILPYPSGTPRNIGIVGPDVSWFPDNRRLLINGGNFNNTMSVLDSTDGSSRVIYRVTGMFRDVSVSPGGKKIIYSGGTAEWNVLEISLPDGRIHTVVGGGGVSWQPDWAPSGTHYLFSTFGAPGGIENRSAMDGFSRRVVEAPPGPETYTLAPRWSPDGTRFLFVQGPMTREQLTIANAVGGRWTTLADNAIETPHAWSPDGQWVAFLRREGGKQQLAKMKPVAGATPRVLAKAIPVAINYSMLQWSPKDDWIAYPSAEGISMISPDGNTVRKLTARNLMAFAFSKDGTQVYGIVHNTTRDTAGTGAQWQLYSIDVKTGVDLLLAPLDFPSSTANLVSFSLHPDGKRFLTSIAKWPYDLWMLEGWDQPYKTWLDSLVRR